MEDLLDLYTVSTVGGEAIKTLVMTIGALWVLRRQKKEKQNLLE
ncbi:hypothetical protein [Flammeovirga sp. SJP92]|nr:hypothetical protein [Flammeovirga sp. SJP92]